MHRFKVAVPEPATDEGLNVAVHPMGKPLTLRATAPLKPPVAVIVTVGVTHPPGETVTVLGITEIAKSGWATTRVTLTEWEIAPLVPVMVSVYVPDGVEPDVETVSIEDPEPPLIGLTERLEVAPAGRPLTPSVTEPLKPPVEATLTL